MSDEDKTLDYVSNKLRELEPNSKEFIQGLLKGPLSLIPGLGVYAISYQEIKANQRRLGIFKTILLYLSDGLQQLQRRNLLDIEYLNSDEYFWTFEKCLKKAIEEYNLRKINNYANAILNSSKIDRHDFNLRDYFINILITMCEYDLMGIEAIYSKKAYDIVSKKGNGKFQEPIRPFHLIQALFPDVTIDIAHSISNRLTNNFVDKAWIHDVSRKDYVEIQYDTVLYQTEVLSSFGLQFLLFIKEY